MISDVLFDAVRKIRDYQLDGYNNTKAEIDAVVFIMDMLRKKFDTPPNLAIPDKDVSFLRACVLLVQDYPELYDEFLRRWVGPLPPVQ